MDDASTSTSATGGFPPSQRAHAQAGQPFPPTLSRDDFAREFHLCNHALWCIAAGVLGDRDRARDVLQDAAIVALKKLADFQRGTSFVHWMGQIVRYTALNEARKHKLRLEEDVDTIPQSSARPQQPHDLPSFDGRTQAALLELDDTARTCLLMRTVLDMSYRQIAEALGIAEGTAMSHVHRSRQRLRATLSQGSEP